jgi:hypothetical protein
MNAVDRPIYGVMAEFETPEVAAKAARILREKGYPQLDAFGPFPSEELAEAIGFRETKVARCVLIGGIVGGICGFGLQYWASVLDYPHNIGGRPFNSWPSFIPITFEATVLFATIVGIISLLVLNRLPRLAHPVFAAPPFVRASVDHFFLCIRANGPDFAPEKAHELLTSFSPLSISVLREEDSS